MKTYFLELVTILKLCKNRPFGFRKKSTQKLENAIKSASMALESQFSKIPFVKVVIYS
jgi:hypothetical protein